MDVIWLIFEHVDEDIPFLHPLASIRVRGNLPWQPETYQTPLLGVREAMRRLCARELLNKSFHRLVLGAGFRVTRC